MLILFYLATSNYKGSVELSKKISALKIDPSPNFTSINRESDLPVTQIFGKRDIFGLASTTSVSTQPKDAVSQTLPELVLQEPQPFTPKKPIDFIDPLQISLVGTIISSDPNNSVCIFGDETDKQSVYKVGDKFKDATVLKIFKDKVVFLRSNGQLETFYLYNNSDLETEIDLSKIVIKEGENKCLINLDTFSKTINNFGIFLDYFDTTPFLDQKTDKVIGFLVLDSQPNSLPDLMGFKYLDLILAIDGKVLTSNKSRQAAFEYVLESATPGNTITVKIERSGVKQDLIFGFFKEQNDKNSSKKSSDLKHLGSKNNSSDEKNLKNFLVSGQKNSLFSTSSVEEKQKQEQERAEFQNNLKRVREQMLARAKSTGQK